MSKFFSVKLSMPMGTNFDILLGLMHYYDKKNYSGAHISWHELVLAENQGNYQNLVPPSPHS